MKKIKPLTENQKAAIAYAIGLLAMFILLQFIDIQHL